jgi:hypothetical protein
LVLALGSTSVDKREVAGRTLGDLIGKVGELVMPEVLPVLRRGLQQQGSASADGAAAVSVHTRQGVCLAVTEILRSASRSLLALHGGVLVPAIRRALCDPAPEVREVAGRAFDQLYRSLPEAALEEVVPPLLYALDPSTATPTVGSDATLSGGSLTQMRAAARARRATARTGAGTAQRRRGVQTTNDSDVASSEQPSEHEEEQPQQPAGESLASKRRRAKEMAQRRARLAAAGQSMEEADAHQDASELAVQGRSRQLQHAERTGSDGNDDSQQQQQQQQQQQIKQLEEEQEAEPENADEDEANRDAQEALAFMQSVSPDQALLGLREILVARSQAVLPFLIPRLLRPPIQVGQLRALAAVAEVSGTALAPHLRLIVPALVEALSPKRATVEALSTSELEAVRVSAGAIVQVVQGEGVHSLMHELMKRIQESELSPAAAVAACELVAQFCQPAVQRAPVSTEEQQLIQQQQQSQKSHTLEIDVHALLSTLVPRLADPNPDLHQAVWRALQAVTGLMRKDTQANHVPHIRTLLETCRERLESAAVARGRAPEPQELELPGFRSARGPEPFVPLLLDSLRYGSAEVRESAAGALADCIRLTPESSLKPFVVSMTGSLMRVVGDRLAASVKLALLVTLELLVRKGGPTLRPFVQQLQSTFVKSLAIPSRPVRLQAATALGALMQHGATRADQLVLELLSACAPGGSGKSGAASAASTIMTELTAADEAGAKEAALQAMRKVMRGARQTLQRGTWLRVLDGLLSAAGDGSGLLESSADQEAVKQRLPSNGTCAWRSARVCHICCVWRPCRSLAGRPVQSSAS